MNTEQENRRPLASRKIALFHRLANFLSGMNVSPNSISVTCVVFAVASGVTLAATAHYDGPIRRVLWIASAALVQLRLLCNLIDGLVAVEGGKGSPVGELYNEVPDRIADAATLIGLGYAIGGRPELGYAAAIIAVFVAYVRAMGASLVKVQAFQGPLAKPQRMFLVTVVCLYCGVAPLALQPIHQATGAAAAAVVLAVIVLGGTFTAARRLAYIARLLNRKE